MCRHELEEPVATSEERETHRELPPTTVVGIIETFWGYGAIPPPKGRWGPDVVWTYGKGECRRAEEKQDECSGGRRGHFDAKASRKGRQRESMSVIKVRGVEGDVEGVKE